MAKPFCTAGVVQLGKVGRKRDVPLMESAAAAALPPPARVLVVGVAGPSGSGKSTVSRGLARALRSPFEPLNMDNWFVPDRMPPDTGSARGELNWETPEGVDAVGFLATVRRICADVAAFCQEARQRGATAAAASASWDADCPAALRSVPDARKRPRAVLRSDLASASDVPPPAATSTVVVVIEGFLLFYWPEVAAACDARLFMCPPHAVCRARRQQRSAWGRGEPEGFDAWYDRLVWPHFQKYLPTQLAHLADGCTLDAQSSDVDAIVRDATAFVARRCRLEAGTMDLRLLFDEQAAMKRRLDELEREGREQRKQLSRIEVLLTRVVSAVCPPHSAGDAAAAAPQ